MSFCDIVCIFLSETETQRNTNYFSVRINTCIFALDSILQSKSNRKHHTVLNIMRIVQTFWSAGRNPLEYSFGWLRPEYNLMSWALSCLCLRKYYDEVALYTDEQGKHLLIDLLHLPYTEVNVVYNETLCLPQHWAYAKIKTYSLQTKPFLHIDGDIFLTKPIQEDVINAPLVAQNREIGTMYYKWMMDRILQEPAIKLPLYIENGLKEDSISSYNMGIFGGSDLKFIGEFCKEAFDFMERNRMNDNTCRQANIDSNVFFEQVIFGVMSDFFKKEVASVVGRAICDEGYTRQEFCNFGRFEENKLLHLLGGHKRNKNITCSFERFMLIHYPNLTKEILGLVNRRNRYNCLSRCRTQVNNIIYSIVPGFEDFIWEKLTLSELVNNDVLLDERKQKIETLPFTGGQKEQDSFVRRSIGLTIFKLPNNISESNMEELKKYLECEPHFPLSHIAVYPSMRQDMFEAVPLGEMDVGVLNDMENKKISINELRDSIIKKVYKNTGIIPEPLLMYAMQHIKYLINTGTLITERVK